MNRFMREFIGGKYDIETTNDYFASSLVLDVYDGWIKLNCEGYIQYINLDFVIKVSPSLVEEDDVKNNPIDTKN
ncbi:hypothetical protein [Ruminococcus sp. NK3A76]|uniref:hypothetical protein n=1 Tax=Ruminococcus sp. NK3A76 TaxID=877411 RepID=UPI00048BB92E|nr:hypothetical protein [Ruminococcus sp. NK3A76]